MPKKQSLSDGYLIKGVGKNIRKLRKKQGLSQEALAFHSRLDRSYIGLVERGKKNVSIVTLNRLSKPLDVKPYELLKV